MVLFDDFRRTLAQLLPVSQPAKLAVAYSGGVDSQVLLHLCYQYAKLNSDVQLRALHVNHGISQHAASWSFHCRQFCQSFGIDYDERVLSLTKTPQKSLEEEAREARYAALSDMIQLDEILVLGQHMQDQTETFLLQLKRGAGPKGLSSMAALGEKAGTSSSMQFIRPLLHVSKQSILEYAQANTLTWQDDESNLDTGFDRNFIRHELVPQLEARWPGFQAATNRSIALIAEQQSMLEEVIQARFEQCLDEDDSLSIENLNRFPFRWQKLVVRAWVEYIARVSKNRQPLKMPTQKVLLAVFETVIQAKDDANPQVVNGQWQFRRFQNRLFLLPIYTSLKSFSWCRTQEKEVELPASLGRFHFGKMPQNTREVIYISSSASVEVVFSGYSVRFKPNGESHSKPLKQWFKIWQVPPWERERVPLLLVDGQLALVGNKPSAEFVKAQGEQSLPCFWQA